MLLPLSYISLPRIGEDKSKLQKQISKLFNIKQRTTLIARKETCCHHMGYSFRLVAMVLLYESSHRQDNVSRRGPLAGIRNRSMGPPWRIDPTTHNTMSEWSMGPPWRMDPTTHRTTSVRSMGPPWRIDPTTHRTMSERRKEQFYLMTHITKKNYGYMASDIWWERKPAAAT